MIIRRTIPPGHIDPIASAPRVDLSLSATDGYKLSHRKFMHEGCTELYLNVTARSGKRAHALNGIPTHIVVGAVQFLIKSELIERFERFFAEPVEKAIAAWSRRVNRYLGEGAVSMDHFRELHAYGRLPITIKAIREGTRVPYRIPLMTMKSTSNFGWLVGYLETVISNSLSQIITSATTAAEFLYLVKIYSERTCDNDLHIPFQCHDFSARGLLLSAGAAANGLGHSMAFAGTDTVGVLDVIESNYSGYPDEYIVGTSVPASEHSVTSLGIAIDGELETIRKWLSKAYPTGIVSLVSDTIDYFRVLTEYLPALKDVILARQPTAYLPAKVVVRPDSGDPFRIVCGYRADEVRENGDGTFTVVGTDEVISQHERRGSLELLEATFGSTTNSKGKKVLDSHIGIIYGDSITLELANRILQRMEEDGWASSNIVFGVGSFTYQYVTRDTHGIAIKATSAVVDNVRVSLFKDPKTDDGTKKSARGLLRVDRVDGELVLRENVTEEEEDGGELIPYMIDGVPCNFEPHIVIRERLHAEVDERLRRDRLARESASDETFALRA